MNREIFPNVNQLVQKAGEQIVEWVKKDIEDKGLCNLCVAGGSTFTPIYEYIVEMYEEEEFWDKVHVFWGDERAVSIMHEDSNVANVFDAFLNDLDIPSSNIHIIQGARETMVASQLYEKELREHFSQSGGFDVLLLGMGNDGHTASLFPHTDALDQSERWVYPVDKEGVKHARITLTAPFLNKSRKVMMVAYGKRKSDAVAAVLNGKQQPQEYPAQLIQPQQGELYWFLDEKAAGKMSVS